MHDMYSTAQLYMQYIRYEYYPCPSSFGFASELSAKFNLRSCMHHRNLDEHLSFLPLLHSVCRSLLIVQTDGHRLLTLLLIQIHNGELQSGDKEVDHLLASP